MAGKRLKPNASSALNVRTRTEKIILNVFFAVFCAYALTLVLPMFWTAYNSLKDPRSFNEDAFNIPSFSDLKWENYSKIFDEQTMTVSIPFAIFNTVWRTFGSVTLNIFFCACTSYVVCKYSQNHKWLNWIYAFVVTIMIIPTLGTTASSYNLIHNELQIANQPLYMWVTWCSGIGFGFLMLYSGWKNLSWSYAEAAFIDGAGHFQVFWRVMFPMIKPVVSALFVVNFISGWSEYMDTVLYMDEWPSLGYMAYALQSQARYFGMPLYFAVIMVAAIPTILVFIGFQETIMKNITAGGLKG